MNLLLLPKNIQDLIGEYNVEHRPQMRLILEQLLEKYKIRLRENTFCINCGDYADERYTTYIFWNKYTFCGGWCQFDVERDIRKSSRKQLQR
jgi:hypothetical protein